MGPNSLPDQNRVKSIKVSFIPKNDWKGLTILKEKWVGSACPSIFGHDIDYLGSFIVMWYTSFLIIETQITARGMQMHLIRSIIDMC